MAIKPILFNTEMVKAILDGGKTQTRRLVKAKGWKINDIPKWREEYVPEYWFTVSNDHQATVIDIRPPYYHGDILWVRETWNINNFRENENTGEEEVGFIYKASDKLDSGFCWKSVPADSYVKYMDSVSEYFDKWRPSIHMPKEAARIFLRVTGVRAERLHDMTDRDAEKEGIGNLYLEDIGFGDKDYGYMKYLEGKGGYVGLQLEQFAHLWDSTIKKDDLPRYGWEANPLVWVIEFERTERKNGEFVEVTE